MTGFLYGASGSPSGRRGAGSVCAAGAIPSLGVHAALSLQGLCMQPSTPLPRTKAPPWPPITAFHPPCPEPRVAAGAGLRALGGMQALHVLEQGWDEPSSGNLNHRVMNRWTWEGCLPQGLGFAASGPAKCIPSWCAWPFMSAPRRAARAPPPIHEGALCRSSSRPACAAPAPPPPLCLGARRARGAA